MKLVTMNWNPTDRQLRQFGLIALVALPLLGWLWGGGNLTVLEVTAAIGAAMAAVGWLYPRGIKPLFIALSLIAMPIGMAISELALLLIFYLVFVPMGLFFRLIGRDALQLKIDRRARTYWQRKKRATGPARYLRQW